VEFSTAFMGAFGARAGQRRIVVSPVDQAAPVEPALPGHWGRPLEGEARSASGGGPYTTICASSPFA